MTTTTPTYIWRNVSGEWLVSAESNTTARDARVGDVLTVSRRNGETSKQKVTHLAGKHRGQMTYRVVEEPSSWVADLRPGPPVTQGFAQQLDINGNPVGPRHQLLRERPSEFEDRAAAARLLREINGIEIENNRVYMTSTGDIVRTRRNRNRGTTFTQRWVPTSIPVEHRGPNTRPGRWTYDRNQLALIERHLTPAEAAEFGHLTNRCVFCYLPLTDDRSTVVGYGPVCARNYRLPWGNRGAA